MTKIQEGPELKCPRKFLFFQGDGSLDCLVHADQGIAAAVEEDVGGGAGRGSDDRLLRHNFHRPVVTAQPTGIPCTQSIN